MSALSVSFLTARFKNKPTPVLVRTITNSQRRLDSIRAAGLANTVAEQNEINRIQAATDVLASRGYYDRQKSASVTVAGVSVPANVTGQGGLIHQPWFKPVAFLALGLFVYRRIL